MADPIGITFMPSQDNQDQGGRNMGLDGPGGADLSQAIKILSLRLPRVQGAQALAPASLLNGQGAGNTGGLNPHAAVFEALLRAILGGGQPPDLSPGGGAMNPPGNIYRPGVPGGSVGGGNRTPAPDVPDYPTRPTPRITPGESDNGAQIGSDVGAMASSGSGALDATFRNPGGARLRRDTGY